MAASTDPFTSAGSKLYVSATAPATYNQAGFAALTFTEVGEVTNFGEFGRVYASVTHNPVATRKTVKRKGSYNDGTLALTLARVTADAGQTILRAALATDSSYSYKVEMQDGVFFYFSAQMMSYTANIGGADQIVGASVSLEIDNDIIEV
jgi:hypothetical protein